MQVRGGYAAVPSLTHPAEWAQVHSRCCRECCVSHSSISSRGKQGCDGALTRGGRVSGLGFWV